MFSVYTRDWNFNCHLFALFCLKWWHWFPLCEPTSIVVVPAPGVVVLKDLWWSPGLQQVVHLVLLPPGQRLAEDLPRLLHVEVPGTQEAQYVLVLWNLGNEGRAFSCTAFVNKYMKYTKQAFTILQISLSTGSFRYAIGTAADGRSFSYNISM